LPVAGKKACRFRRLGHGSPVVQVNVRIPLSPGQRRLYKQLRALETGPPEPAILRGDGSFDPARAACPHAVVKAMENNGIPDQGGVPVIKQRNPEPPAAALEERVHVLEERVTALADAIRVLARGLEDVPTIEPGQRPAAKAARRAYELLLVAEPRPPDVRAGAAHPGP
jgi:hypothetical protein